MNDRDDAIEIDGVLLEETELAILIDPGGPTVWLPKSLIEYAEEGKGGLVSVTLPRWLAEEKGLV